MKYIKWQDELANHLNGLSAEEKQKVFNYFSEMYADKRDAGLSEEQIIESFGAPYDVAKRILSENAAGQPTAPEYDAPPVQAAQTPQAVQPIQAPQASQPAQSAPIAQPYAYSQPEKAHTPSAPAPSGAATKTHSGNGWKIGLGIFGGVVLIILIVVGAIFIAASARANRIHFDVKSYTAESLTDSVDISIAAGECEVVLYDGDAVVFEYPDGNYFGYVPRQNAGTAVLEPTKYIKHWFIDSLAMSMYGWDKIPKTVIKLPQNKAFNLTCNLAAGDLKIANATYGDVDLSVAAGNLTTSVMTCKNLKVSLSAGRIDIGGVTCDNIDCAVSAGTLRVGESSCKTLTSDLSAGTVNFSKLVCDKIDADVSAGTMAIALGGKQSEYTILTDVSAGSCNLTPQSGTDPEKRINLDLSAGTLNVTFTD